MSKKVLSRGIRGLITSKQGSKNVRLTLKRDYLMRAGQASNGGTAGNDKRSRSTNTIGRNQREFFRIATGMRRRMPTPTPSRIARTEAAPIAALERKSITACQRLTKPSMQRMAGLGEVTKGMVYSCGMACGEGSRRKRPCTKSCAGLATSIPRRANLRRGQGKNERAAVSEFAFGADGTAVGAHDVFGDGEA